MAFIIRTNSVSQDKNTAFFGDLADISPAEKFHLEARGETALDAAWRLGDSSPRENVTHGTVPWKADDQLLEENLPLY